MIENQEIIITNLKEENKRLKLESISKKYYKQELITSRTNLEKSKIETTLPMIDAHYMKQDTLDDPMVNQLDLNPSNNNLEEISMMMKRILEEN
jgi:hypothetical protein